MFVDYIYNGFIADIPPSLQRVLRVSRFAVVAELFLTIAQVITLRDNMALQSLEDYENFSPCVSQ